MKLKCTHCGGGEDFVATALLYSDIKVGPDGWPAGDYDDLEHFSSPIGEGPAAYSCLLCDRELSPIYDDEEEKSDAIANLHHLANRLTAEIAGLEDRLEKEAR